MEIINTRKRKRFNIVQCSKRSKRFCCCERVQPQKFKTLSGIPNHNLSSRNLNNTSFYLSKFLTKINDKIFPINEKHLFCGQFCAKEILITTAVVPQHLDVKDTEYGRLFYHDQQAKVIQSIHFIHEIIYEMHLKHQ